MNSFYQRSFNSEVPEENYERVIEQVPSPPRTIEVQKTNYAFMIGASVVLVMGVFTFIGANYVQKSKVENDSNNQQAYYGESSGPSSDDGFSSQNRFGKGGQQHENVDWDVTVVGRGSHSGERYHLRYRRLAQEKEMRYPISNEPFEADRNQRAESQTDSPQR